MKDYQNPPTYVVITPVKNEADYIENTINSMIHQSLKPKVWIIVDDGSSDSTGAIVRKYSTSHDWIRLLTRNDQGKRKRGERVIKAFHSGQVILPEFYDFIVKLDGDLSFDSDYFESIINQFIADPRLGIAGGGVYEKRDGSNWQLFSYEDEVRGCTKIYRRTCFDDIGGLIPAMGWDGIDEWTALARGWRVRSFLQHKMYHYRFTGAATGYIKSFIEQGYAAHFIGYHPLYLIARAIRCMIDPPYIIGGFSLAIAFFKAKLQNYEMYSDLSVIRYVRKVQKDRLICLIKGKPFHGTREPI